MTRRKHAWRERAPGSWLSSRRSADGRVRAGRLLILALIVAAGTAALWALFLILRDLWVFVIAASAP
jgi:hypothetical protein